MAAHDYPRPTLLQRLLTGDGVIFISIDVIEAQNLKAVCDKILGKQFYMGKVDGSNNN